MSWWYNFSVLLPVLQWHIILGWRWISMAYSHLNKSWAPSYLLQVNYQHFQLRYLNYQHIWWSIRLFHTSTVPSQHLYLDIIQVVQSSPLTDRSYSTHPCLPLAWNLCKSSRHHNIWCIYNTGLHLDWSPASFIHKHLTRMICIQETSKFMIVMPSMQHQSS